MSRNIEFILLAVFTVSSCIDTGINVLKYNISNNGSNKCVDNSKYETFYVVKGGIGYCFERSRTYPYRVHGGIIDVNGE